MPWVIVSIRNSLAERGQRSANREQRRTLADYAADLAGWHIVALQRIECRLRVCRINGDEQAARGLWIEKEILIFARHAGCESGAMRNEGAIVFQPAGEMAFPRGFHGAREINKRGVVDFQRNGCDVIGG